MRTRATARGTASMEAVLSKPELVEAILLRLSMRDLLVNAPRVCKTFNTVILSSPSIQRKLFFSADPRLHPTNSPQEWTANPLLQEAFPPLFENDRWGLKSFESFWKLDWNSSEHNIVAYARHEASWRRMLVAQPPLTNLKLKLCRSSMRMQTQKPGMIQLKDGIRMGTLYDRLEQFRAPFSSFSVQWHVNPEHENSPHVTICLRYTVQCAIGSGGRGSGRREGGTETKWVFKSEGYKHVPVRLEDVPQHIVDAERMEQAQETARAIRATLAQISQ